MSKNNTDTTPQKKPKKVNKKIKVALFCIAALIVFYFGANFLKGIDIFGKRSYYYAVFDDIGTLSPSSIVTLNGYKIGKVNKINLLNNNPVKICAEILIMENVNIPKDSYFEVVKKDILSNAVVDVKLGTSKTIAQSRDTLVAIVGGDMFSSLLDNLGGTLASVQSIATELSTNLVDNGGIEKLNNSIAKFESTMSNIDQIVAENGAEIKYMITSLTLFSQKLKEASPKLELLVDNFNDLTDTVKIEIATLVNQTGQTLEAVNTFMSMLNNPDGNVGKLLNDNTLYNNLNAATDNLDKLLIDLKANPGRYIHISVFGGNKDKKDKNK
ncbi:MAG: MlaD family protein [Bacteroidales bacterium]|jgi:phospholipid/cholesterol/gamma-HCH transport system substrate-binding protein|nr:MlaD family protein [Bacteroidales bacterium]